MLRFVRQGRFFVVNFFAHDGKVLYTCTDTPIHTHKNFCGNIVWLRKISQCTWVKRFNSILSCKIIYFLDIRYYKSSSERSRLCKFLRALFLLIYNLSKNDFNVSVFIVNLAYLGLYWHTIRPGLFCVDLRAFFKSPRGVIFL